MVAKKNEPTDSPLCPKCAEPIEWWHCDWEYYVDGHPYMCERCEDILLLRRVVKFTVEENKEINW